MNFRAHGRRRGDALLDMAPLIDVVFLLLIFFLLTSTFVRQREMVVTINLPSGSAQPMPHEPEDLSIFVQANGQFTVRAGETEQGRAMDYDALHTELQTLYDTRPDMSVYLRGDRDVNYGSVIDILLLAREIGFQRVQAVIRDDRQHPGTP